MVELERLCKEAYDSAYSIVKEQRFKIYRLTDMLMEKEYLSQEEIEKFLFRFKKV